jgi:hypothetical protein
MRASQSSGKSFLLLTSMLASLLSTHGAVISSCDPAGLEAAVESGGNFTFACDANITLTSTLNVSNHLVLDGTGHHIVINGNNAVRLFNVAPGAYLELVNLSLINGRYVGTNGASGANGTQAQPGESGNGGAILADNATVKLISCVLSNSSVLGGAGGNYTSFETVGAKSGGLGVGGAICLLNGVLSATDCVFTHNQAMGAAGGANYKDMTFAPPGTSLGGAVYNLGGTLNLTNDHFGSNLSTGSVAVFAGLIDGPAGSALGGAVHSAAGIVNVIDCSFVGNTARSGPPPVYGGAGSGKGGAISLTNSVLFSLRSRFETNRAMGGSQRFFGGGQGIGGAVFNQGTGDFHLCTFQGNLSQSGSAGNVGGDSAGGGVYNGLACQFEGCLFFENKTIGGVGHGLQGGAGKGGNGLGGGIYSLGALSLTNCTLINNVSQGADGDADWHNIRGQGGAGKGAGLFNAAGDAVLMNVTITQNGILNGVGNPNGTGAGGGIYSTNGTVTLFDTIVAHSPSGSNCFGVVTDGGYNLSSDTSCNFTNTGSLNNIDPLLGPLQDNGGTTLTTALTDCSPALDAGSPTVFASVDQRGVSRPIAGRSDIGACEGIVTWYHTLLSFPNSGVEVKMFGKPNQTFTIHTSLDLANWTPIFTNQLGPNCIYLFNTTKEPQAFYKVVYQ